MKKRRDIIQALQEDSRISSLEGNLRRLTSEVEAYRRFSERTCAQSGSKNHQEDLQKLVLDEQERVARLRDELAKAHEAFARERKEEANSRAAEVSALREEVQRLQFSRDQDPALTSRELSGPATEANATRRKQLETDIRLEQLARRDLERRLERAARRAERAESEVKALQEQLQNLQREQRVKDAQLDAVRGDLQDLLLSHPTYDDDRSRRVDQTHARNLLLSGTTADTVALSTPSSFESKNEDHAVLEGKGDASEDEEDFQDVLAAEMESMRISYEEKMAVLEQRLEDAQRELKSARLG